MKDVLQMLGADLADLLGSRIPADHSRSVLADSYAARCLARPGQEYLIFNRAGFGPQRHFDEATRATLTLPGLSGAAGSYAGPAPVLRADWLQPLSGERQQSEVQVRSRFPLQAPFDGPYVVRLRPA